MLSIIDKDLKIINGIMTIVPKEYPNWYGIKVIGFIWKGNWSDFYIEYKGRQMNGVTIEDSMWSQYREEFPNGNEEDFVEYMKLHTDDVIEYIELALESEV